VRMLLKLAVFLAGLLFASANDGTAAEKKDAKKLANDADRAFRNDQLDVATRLYSEAVQLEQQQGVDIRTRAKTYYARHKVYMKQKKLQAAISDLTEAVKLDNAFVMGYLQRANLNLMTGRCKEAVEDYHETLRRDPNKRDAKTRLPHASACLSALERAEYAKRSGDWHTVREQLAQAMEGDRASAAPALLLQRAEAHFRLQSFDDAIADSARVLKLEPGSIAAYSIRAQALARRGSYDDARKHWQQCLQYDPESKVCKEGYRLLKSIARIKERGDQAIEQSRWGDAVEQWQEGLTVAQQAMQFGQGNGGSSIADRVYPNPTWQGEVLPKLAKSLWKKGSAEDAERYARMAIQFNEASGDAHAILAEVLLSKEQWDEAVREAHRAHDSDRGSHEFRDLLQRAEAAKKQAGQKNYYAILGVPRGADDGAIKKAYRAGARQWHPDMAPADDPAEKERYEAKFRDIAEAYDVLSDPEKRQRYDRGEDVNQPQGGPGGPGGPGGFPFGGPGGPFGGGGGFTFTFRAG
jgi:tetratricopeptide (TPR) repeat protein